MNKRNNIFVLLVSLLLGVALAMPTAAHAQVLRQCFDNTSINPLVKAKKIISFKRIEKKLRLKKGTKIFNQDFCIVDGRYVYFFNVVDSYGRKKKVALHADDGTPYKDK